MLKRFVPLFIFLALFLALSMVRVEVAFATGFGMTFEHSFPSSGMVQFEVSKVPGGSAGNVDEVVVMILKDREGEYQHYMCPESGPIGDVSDLLGLRIFVARRSDDFRGQDTVTVSVMGLAPGGTYRYFIQAYWDDAEGYRRCSLETGSTNGHLTLPGTPSDSYLQIEAAEKLGFPALVEAQAKAKIAAKARAEAKAKEEAAEYERRMAQHDLSVREQLAREKAIADAKAQFKAQKEAQERLRSQNQADNASVNSGSSSSTSSSSAASNSTSRAAERSVRRTTRNSSSSQDLAGDFLRLERVGFFSRLARPRRSFGGHYDRRSRGAVVTLSARVSGNATRVSEDTGLLFSCTGSYWTGSEYATFYEHKEPIIFRDIRVRNGVAKAPLFFPFSRREIRDLKKHGIFRCSIEDPEVSDRDSSKGWMGKNGNYVIRFWDHVRNGVYTVQYQKRRLKVVVE